jgi:putative protease
MAKKKIAKPKKKTTKAKAAKAAKPIGKVTHFFNKISVAIVKFSLPIPVGMTVWFKGATTDFKAPVKSMQYDHKPIMKAPKGKQVGIKVKKSVREGDKVFRAE